MPHEMSLQFSNCFEFVRATLDKSIANTMRMRIMILCIGQWFKFNIANTTEHFTMFGHKLFHLSFTQLRHKFGNFSEFLLLIHHFSCEQMRNSSFALFAFFIPSLNGLASLQFLRCYSLWQKQRANCSWAKHSIWMVWFFKKKLSEKSPVLWLNFKWSSSFLLDLNL